MNQVMAERFDIVISGASFAGLALTRALSMSLGSNFRIALIDRAPLSSAVAPDSRASAISAASKRMLDVLGVWGDVAAEAEPVTEIEITDSSLDAGVRPTLLTYHNEIAAGEPATYIVPNAVLMAGLAKSVRDDAAITLLTPEAARNFSVAEPSVKVTLVNSVLTAALLVAADGRTSKLREAAGIKVVGWDYPQTGIVTTVAFDRPHQGRAVQHFLPSGPFAILPLKGDRACITWTEDAAEARRILALDDTAFLAEVDQRFGGKLGTLRLDGPRQSWPLAMHLARSYIAPRFALIGDAAHGVHPIAGQGLNLALRDAAALTECIAEAAHLGLDPGAAFALEKYERWRRFDNLTSAAAFDALNRLFSNDWTLMRAARDAGLALVDRVPELKAYFVSEGAGLSGELPKLLRGEAIAV